jgi:hypothetical protein
LEKLIDSPSSQRHQANLSTLADYNKDYTALLLNCYVKTKMPEKISNLIEKASQGGGGGGGKDTIFDVATAIEVCRQQDDTLKQAEELASKSQQWSLLVQITIENRKDPAKALQIIDENISNLKEKVECLQLYAPKLFKAIRAENDRDRQGGITMSDYNRTRLIDKLQNLVKQIVDALIEYKRNKGKFLSNNYQHFELKEK